MFYWLVWQNAHNAEVNSLSQMTAFKNCDLSFPFNSITTSIQKLFDYFFTASHHLQYQIDWILSYMI